MEQFKIGELIEYTIQTDGVDIPIDYEVQLDGDTIYLGKLYPYPGTDKTVVTLNDIVESYLNYNDFDFDAFGYQAGGDTVKSLNLPNMRKTFTLIADDTYEFMVYLSYIKLGDSFEIDDYQKLKHTTIDFGQDLYFIFSTTAGEKNMLIKYYVGGSLDDSTEITFTSIADGFVAVKINPEPLYGGDANPDEIIIHDIYGNVKFYYKIGGCHKYYVYWFNELGGIECINGNLTSKMKTDAEPIEYKRKYRTFNYDTSLMQGNQSNFGIDRSVITTSDKYLINTEILTTEQHKAMDSIYSTPKCWIYDKELHLYFSVTCMDLNYEEKIFRVDKMISKTLNFEKTIKNRRR